MRPSFDLDEQLMCVRREIAMRRRVYPRWVAQGKMTQKKMDYEIAAMEAVLATLIHQQGAPRQRALW